MEKWVLLRKGADFQSISEKFHIHPRIAALIRNREVVGDENIRKYLLGTLADVHHPMLFQDVEVAVELLMKKISEGKKIRIIGDYDIDGINATYILLQALKRVGAAVDSEIPDRIKDGYGLNQSLIEAAGEDEIDTIITCDNGIAAAKEIALAKELGMTVIVTDHHEVPYEEAEGKRTYILPPADAVVDPKREDCGYPFSGICGATVAYKVMVALYQKMGRAVEELDDLLENVAFATIGDVMELKDENRIYVKEGLKRINHTSNIGMQSLIEATEQTGKSINGYSIGFILGPCLNASGRLDTAKKALRLLNATNKKDADVLAWELKALNDNRKELTELAVEEAVRQVETTKLRYDKVLVLFLEECHESIAGIVAGRVRERFQKPTFVLTRGEEGLKGSGRSIDAYHMYEGLNECKELLSKFGGHKLAAGLSLEEKNLDAFRKQLNENCQLTESDFVAKVTLDMEMPLGAIDEGFIKQLDFLEPFGNGNEKPVFVLRNLEFLSGRIVGKNKNVLKLQVRDSQGTRMDAMLFRNLEEMETTIDEKYGKGAFTRLVSPRGRGGVFMDVTYYPSVNEFRGERTIQITITHFR